MYSNPVFLYGDSGSQLQQIEENRRRQKKTPQVFGAEPILGSGDFPNKEKDLKAAGWLATLYQLSQKGSLSADEQALWDKIVGELNGLQLDPEFQEIKNQLLNGSTFDKTKWHDAATKLESLIKQIFQSSGGLDRSSAGFEDAVAGLLMFAVGFCSSRVDGDKEDFLDGIFKDLFSTTDFAFFLEKFFKEKLHFEGKLSGIVPPNGATKELYNDLVEFEKPGVVFCSTHEAAIYCEVDFRK